MENTYILYEGDRCILIDPGMNTRAEEQVVENFVEENKLRVERILLTHAHIDHIFGLKWSQERFRLPAWCHPQEQVVLEHTSQVAEIYGFPPMEPPSNIRIFSDTDTIDVGDMHLDIVFTPGHSPGSVCYLDRTNKVVIAGDVLFRESIGRTDLPGGDYDTLMNSIRQNLLALEDDWVVCPGHGPKTTIGYERRHNPFL